MLRTTNLDGKELTNLLSPNPKIVPKKQSFYTSKLQRNCYCSGYSMIANYTTAMLMTATLPLVGMTQGS